MLETRGRKDCFTSEYKNNFIVGECVDDTFFILVSDTGVGVSHDSISSVFDRFYKVNTVNTDSHLGTGIGLALVKSLVLLHKGSISILVKEDGVLIWLSVCLLIVVCLMNPIL